MLEIEFLRTIVLMLGAMDFALIILIALILERVLPKAPPRPRTQDQ
jgi:hypothetical protein